MIEGLSSRYVLVYAGINDVAIKGAEKYDNMKSPDPKRRFADSIKNKSALYEMYKIVKGILAARMAKVVYGSGPRAGLDWQPWHRRDEPLEIPGDLSEHLEAYKSRIIHLNEEIHKFGAKPIFVTQPSADYRFRGNWILLPAGDKHDDAKNQFLVLNAFNHVAMRTCLDLGGICLDLAADVTFEDGDFYDRIHNSDKGAEKVGKYLFEALRSYL